MVFKTVESKYLIINKYRPSGPRYVISMSLPSI